MEEEKVEKVKGKVVKSKQEQKRINKRNSMFWGLGVTVVFGLLMWYLTLPALNVQNEALWGSIILLSLVYSLVYALVYSVLDGKTKLHKSANGIVFDANIKRDVPLKKLWRTKEGIGITVAAVALLVLIVGKFFSATFFHAKQYANIIQVTNSEFATDMPETTNISNIALMDTESAKIIGNRTLGSLSDVVSQYEIAKNYSQINYRHQPKKVASLEYAGLIKWIKNKNSGIPGYVMVDPVSNDAQYVKFSKSVKYTDSGYFGDDLKRKLRFEYPTKMFGSYYFEVDDEGNPYYIVSCLKANVGLFGAKDVAEVVIFNPCDGSSVLYDVADVPSWVDIVFDGDLATKKYNWYGDLSGGFWNSVLGNKDCKKTTDDYGYITIDDDVWYFTGVTSVTGDESNIGFIITNARTGEYRYYSVNGAEEYSAMHAAEGEVQEKGYVASFPSLVNISGQPSYIMVLKDSGGLVKLYALVNVEKYSIVATGTTQNEAISNYRKLLQKANMDEPGDSETETADVVVSLVRIIEIDKQAVVYLTAEDGTVYKSYLNTDESLILIREGDALSICYDETDIPGIREIFTWTRK